MCFKKIFDSLSSDRKVLLQKVIDTLSMGARSKKTISNYVHSINRFFNFFPNVDISKLNETDIVEYIKTNYLSKNCSANTYNMNISAIKYFYSINFNKTFNSKLIPNAKLVKRIPTTIDNYLFTRIFNEESNLKHKCWLLLAFYSGLRVDEVASLRISHIFAKEHKLKVLGKGNKERFTFIPDITIKHLRLFYKQKYFKNGFRIRSHSSDFVFVGNQNLEHTSSKSISNYFSTIKSKYGLDDSITFHSLRHSFATNFINNGGDPFVLKAMLGHSSFNTTSIYLHLGRDFNNLKGVCYE